MEKTSAVLVASLLLATSAAQAQTNWTGPFVGVNANMITTNVETADYWCWQACDAPGSTKTSPNLGFSAGYNWQLDKNFVVGVEADLGMGTSSSNKISFEEEAGVRGVVWSDKLKNMMSVRAKAGLALDKTMIYVTAGPAVAKMSFSANEYHPEDVPDSAHFSGNVSGFTAGFGLEHKLQNNLSFKAEYLMTSLKAKSACWFENGECSNVGQQNDDKVNWRPQVNQIRVGLNYSFE